MQTTRQTGDIDDYVVLFEERVAQHPSLPPEQYLGRFLGGLQPSSREEKADSELSDVLAAIRAARCGACASMPPTHFSEPSYTQTSGPFHSPLWNSGGTSSLAQIHYSSKLAQSQMSSSGHRPNHTIHITADEDELEEQHLDTVQLVFAGD
ncbi:hypothetical protein OROGR_011414 [Orobanche gracilis]